MTYGLLILAILVMIAVNAAMWIVTILGRRGVRRYRTPRGFAEHETNEY